MVLIRLLLVLGIIGVFVGCSKKQPQLNIEYKMSNSYARAPVTAEFVAGSTMRAENITYQWSINNVQIQGNQKKMKYTFHSPGEYTIEVYMNSTDKPSLYKSVILQVVANKPPECDFTYSEPAFVGDLVHFTPQCTDVDGKVVKYVWSYGDGKISQMARHRYAQPGGYVVTLYATDDANGISEISKRVLIRAR